MRFFREVHAEDKLFKRPTDRKQKRLEFKCLQSLYHCTAKLNKFPIHAVQCPKQSVAVISRVLRMYVRVQSARVTPVHTQGFPCLLHTHLHIKCTCTHTHVNTYQIEEEEYLYPSDVLIPYGLPV